MEAGILLGRSSDHSVVSKGGFQASSDLECDQLNMKKCLIKLTWKSLKGSQKLKATMPAPHGIWQSSRSPLAANAGLSLQRDVQPFHFSGCCHSSRGTILGAAVSTATLPLWTRVGATYLRGPDFTWWRQIEKSYPFFHCWSLAAWQRMAPCWGCPWEERCRASPAVKASGGPLLHAIGIEALYSFFKENLCWTSKLL